MGSIIGVTKSDTRSLDYIPRQTSEFLDLGSFSGSVDFLEESAWIRAQVLGELIGTVFHFGSTR